VSGQLFAQYFLTDGIRATPHWGRAVAGPGAFGVFCETVRQKLRACSGVATPHEAATEEELVRPRAGR